MIPPTEAVFFCLQVGDLDALNNNKTPLYYTKPSSPRRMRNKLPPSNSDLNAPHATTKRAKIIAI